jgi:transcriptional regulator GlxA family with amidase domain
MNLIVLLLPGVLDGSLGVTLDAALAANRLRRAAGQPDLFLVRQATPRGRTQHTAAGLRVGPLQPLPAVDKGDLIVVPGSNAATAPEVEAWLATPPVQQAARWLAQALDAGASVAAGCTGTFVLAEAGLLAGRHATTTWWLAPLFRQRYPDVTLDVEHMVVPAGRVTTAGAALAQADLMLALIGRFGSARLAAACTRYLLIDPRGLQSRYAVLNHLARADPFLVELEGLIEARLAQPESIDDLAAAMHVSARTLARRVQAAVGLSPVRLVQRVRIEHALHLLETSDLPIDDVAAQVGYADPATLRRLLKRSVGDGPSALRKRRRPASSVGRRPPT